MKLDIKGAIKKGELLKKEQEKKLQEKILAEKEAEDQKQKDRLQQANKRVDTIISGIEASITSAVANGQDYASLFSYDTRAYNYPEQHAHNELTAKLLMKQLQKLKLNPFDKNVQEWEWSNYDTGSTYNFNVRHICIIIPKGII